MGKSPDELRDAPLVDGIWGHVVYTQHYDGPQAGTVTLDRADPFVLVLDEVLHETMLRPLTLQGVPVFRLQGPPDTGWCDVGPGVCGYPSHPFCFTGWLLHIELPGHHLIYRVGKYRPEGNRWEAAWPD